MCVERLNISNQGIRAINNNIFRRNSELVNNRNKIVLFI